MLTYVGNWNSEEVFEAEEKEGGIELKENLRKVDISIYIFQLNPQNYKVVNMSGGTRRNVYNLGTLDSCRSEAFRGSDDVDSTSQHDALW